MDVSTTGVDLFCGVGGLTYGLERAGIPVEVGIDTDEDCRYAYEESNEAMFLKTDIANLDSERVASWFADEEVQILAGCVPCQPFSPLNNSKNASEHEQWALLRPFGRLIRRLQPGIVVTENVPEIQNYEVFADFLDVLSKSGYHVSKQVIYCPEYGIPQRRKRLVLLASRFGSIELRNPFRSPSQYATVRDAIGNEAVEPIGAGDVSSEDRLHRSRALSDLNQERIRQSEPGGSWQDWDSNLKLMCHKCESGRSFTNVYGRMEWDEPAPTLTTQFYNYGSGRFGHPEQDRALSLREGALLQTFPKDYDFVKNPEDASFKEVGRLIGNAVPIRLAEAIGESLRQHIEENF